MVPFIIGSAVVALLLHELSKTDPTLANTFDSDSVSDEFMESLGDNHLKHFGLVKARMVKNVNHLIENRKKFKIGKSGNPVQRFSQYEKYKYMYLLIETDKKEIASQLEAFLNEKFIDHRKNENLKIGSAGDAKASNGKYYVYAVVR